MQADELLSSSDSTDSMPVTSHADTYATTIEYSRHLIPPASLFKFDGQLRKSSKIEPPRASSLWANTGGSGSILRLDELRLSGKFSFECSNDGRGLHHAIQLQSFNMQTRTAPRKNTWVGPLSSCPYPRALGRDATDIPPHWKRARRVWCCTTGSRRRRMTQCDEE